MNGPKDPWPCVLSLPGAQVVCWRPHPANTRQYYVFLSEALSLEVWNPYTAFSTVPAPAYTIHSIILIQHAVTMVTVAVSESNTQGHERQGRIQDFLWGWPNQKKWGQFGPCGPHMAPNSVLNGSSGTLGPMTL